MHSSGFYRKPGGIMPCTNPVRKKKRLGAAQSPKPNPVPRTKKPLGQFYRPRDPWKSLTRENHETPFFKVVRDHFDEFERVYPERYQAKYGYWRRFEVPAGGRPVIRKSIDKFPKCGDLKKGLSASLLFRKIFRIAAVPVCSFFEIARVRCPDCHEEFFLAFF
jgi:hypothetical protein